MPQGAELVHTVTHMVNIVRKLLGLWCRSLSALPFRQVSVLIKLVWTKYVACHISKQRMSTPSSYQPLQPPPTVYPEGIQYGEKTGY